MEASGTFGTPLSLAVIERCIFFTDTACAKKKNDFDAKNYMFPSTSVFRDRERGREDSSVDHALCNSSAITIDIC